MNGASLPVLLSADNVSGKESKIVGWVQSFTDGKPSLSLSQHLASVHTGLVMEKAPSFSLLLFPSNQRVFAGLSGLQAHLPSQTLQSLDAAVSMCVSLALHQTARFCPESTDGCFNSEQTINVRQIHAESATDWLNVLDWMHSLQIKKEKETISHCSVVHCMIMKFRLFFTFVEIFWHFLWNNKSCMKMKIFFCFVCKKK